MKRRLHTVNEKKKDKKIPRQLHRAAPLSVRERGFFTVFSLVGTIRMGKISLSFPIILFFLRHQSCASCFGVKVSLSVRARVALLSNDKRCSIVVAGVLGSLVVLSGKGARGCIYVGPTRSGCHVITWVGGRYMKDGWALVTGVGFIHLLCNSVLSPRALKKVRAYIVWGMNSIGSYSLFMLCLMLSRC